MANINPLFCYLHHPKDWLLLIAINTLIAIFLSLVGQSIFWNNFIYSQAIGISIASLIALFVLRSSNPSPNPIYFILAIITGVIIGIGVGTLLTGGSVLTGNNHQKILGNSLAYSFIIGCVVVFFFYTYNKQQQLNNQLNIEKLKQAKVEQALVESNLKMLQAQIEPHFLFNTLSNILGLIDNRPDDAKNMLGNLTDYLRGSLDRTRQSNATLGDEIALVNAYLAIQKIRMGERLNYQFTINESLSTLNFPPLLIQPLVENAIRHGLESEVGGGDIQISINQQQQNLHIVVSDTGKGIKNTTSKGIGLKNIHARLAALYPEQATLTTRPNRPKGLIVEITIPMEAA